MNPRDEIIRRLDSVEQPSGYIPNDAKVLYAAESGSRAWGFESPDSDYDVRFIYVRRPEFYLSVDWRYHPKSRRVRDVIEIPMDEDRIYDVNGWDLMKSMHLMRKCNPVLFEWLRSPTVYRDVLGVRDTLLVLTEKFFQIKPLLYHYHHLALGNWSRYLKDREMVKPKKYLYVLRALTAMHWTHLYNAPPPVEFHVMFADLRDDGLTPSYVDAVETLLEEKSRGFEMDEVPANKVLNENIEMFFSEWDSLLASDYGKFTHSERVQEENTVLLDTTFRSVLDDVWG